MNETSVNYYQEQIISSDNKIKRYNKLINTYSFLRLAAVFLWFIMIYQSLQFERVWVTELAFLLPIFLFAFLVKMQSKFEVRKQYFTDLKTINENEISSLRDKKNIYSEGSVWINDQHIYSSDLDVFGKGSLFLLMNRCSTLLGNTKLAGWLNAHASSNIVRERQASVQELSVKIGWKQHFQAVLLFANQAKEDPVSKLFQYLKASSEKPSIGLKRYITWIPAITLPFVVLSFFIPKLIIILILLGIINLLIVQYSSSQVEKTENLIGKAGKTLSQFSEAIKAIEEESWNSAVCKQLAQKLKGQNNHKLSNQIKHLSVLISRLDLRSGILIGFFLNVTIAWDVRQFFAIEDWKTKNEVDIEHAFDVIAAFEALISISSLQVNNPEWCFPTIIDHEQYTLTAKAIGHPLIKPAIRVDNDYVLHDELKIDIITGSNMAGKSTFLRTLGINTVLALCGAPVCAREMSLTCMTVFTYMRIRDSLNENTSTFKAELDRLRLLLEVLQKEGKVYFLIDEMLRGTNSVDKYRGSKAVIEKLIAEKAVGIVATHDLQIAHLEQKYPAYIRNFYFDIRVEGQEMQFDYKLKPGECKTFNASLLLKQLGIEVEAD